MTPYWCHSLHAVPVFPLCAQVPYSALMWLTRTLVNFCIVMGVSVAVVWLFALTLTAWGERVGSVVRAPIWVLSAYSINRTFFFADRG